MKGGRQHRDVYIEGTKEVAGQKRGCFHVWLLDVGARHTHPQPLKQQFAEPGLLLFLLSSLFLFSVHCCSAFMDLCKGVRCPSYRQV